MIWYGGGGGALPALVPSSVGHVCRPPINILYLNCCSQFAYHRVLLLKLLYLILSLLFFALS
jgi:hypothetical protein